MAENRLDDNKLKRHPAGNERSSRGECKSLRLSEAELETKKKNKLHTPLQGGIVLTK